MTDLPRSRAIVRLDGPGHIMPVEPVTPADSRAWHVIHLPIVLAGVSTGVLLCLGLAVRVFGKGLAVHIPGARFLLVLIGAAVAGWIYWAFTRFVERRYHLQELEAEGAFGEFALAYVGGLAIPLALFTTLRLAGSLHVVGFNPLSTMLAPFVVQLCLAVVLELIICGLAFRLVERWLGSWPAVAITMIFFSGIFFLVNDATPKNTLAVAVQALLLVAAPFMATRRLWAPIGIHAGWRFGGGLAFNGTALSPTGPHGFVLSTVVGPDWLTGGQAGLNASVPALCIDLLVAALLLAVAVRRGRIVRPAWRRGRAT